MMRVMSTGPSTSTSPGAGAATAPAGGPPDVPFERKAFEGEVIDVMGGAARWEIRVEVSGVAPGAAPTAAPDTRGAG